MNNVALVHIIESLTNLGKNAYSFLYGQNVSRLKEQAIAQGIARNKLCHQVWHIIIYASVQ